MTTEIKQSNIGGNAINQSSLKTKLDAQVDPAVVTGAGKAASSSTPAVKEIVDKVEQAITKAVEQKAPVPEVIQEKMYHVFYSGMTSCRMITTTGRVIAFVLGKYVTDIKEDIDYLKAEIAAGSRNLSVVPGEEVMSAADLDPMASLKKKYFKEFAEAQAEVARKIAAGESLTQSESELQQLTPGSTADIASLASGS